MIITVRDKILITTVISIIFCLLLPMFIYWQGLNSPFIFDDIPNLSPIGKYQHLGIWHDIFLFLLNGDSGPTGRPISLLSFYLNDNSWQGADSSDFKYTNLMIHLINGLLIYWFIYKITKSLNLSSHYVVWLAPITTCIWLIAPIHNTTVLYVVQRMTELSSLFSILTIIIYLCIRDQLINNKKQIIFLTTIFIISYILAILSKENGILISIYILTLEYFLFNKKRSKKLNYFLYFFSWLPLLIICILLIKSGLSSNNSRIFTSGERLLTESRVIWDYLFQILLPQTNFITLLHDDYQISHNLFDPWYTILAIFGIIALIYACWFFRKTHIFLSFGIAWFLAGHILESTSIPLELYFEHRNYLPSLGIYLILSFSLLKFSLINNKLKNLSLFLLISYLSLLAVSNYNLSRRWTNSIEMTNVWLVNHPNSQRTLELLDVLIGKKLDGKAREKILFELDKIAEITNTNSYLVFRNLEIQCQNNSISNNSLNTAIQKLQENNFVAATPTNFANFIQSWLNSNCGSISSEHIIDFIEKIKSIKKLQISIFPQTLNYWQAQVHVKQGNLDATIKLLDDAYTLHKSIDITLEEANYLSSAGLYQEAEIKLAHLEPDFCGNWRSCMILKLRQPDIDNLKTAIQAAQQKANNNEQAVHHSTREERS